MEIVAVIHKEDGAYGISFPDLPGCTSAADSRESLLSNAQEALAGHLECLKETGHPVPLLRPEAHLRLVPEFDEDFADATEVIVVRVPDASTPMTKPQAAE